MKPVSETFVSVLSSRTRVYRSSDGSDRPWRLKRWTPDGETEDRFATLSEAVKAWGADG